MFTPEDEVVNLLSTEGSRGIVSDESYQNKNEETRITHMMVEQYGSYGQMRCIKIMVNIGKANAGA